MSEQTDLDIQKLADEILPLEVNEALKVIREKSKTMTPIDFNRLILAIALDATGEKEGEN